jgi:predicted RNA binding protein YcfA (HicA-like mRNA interferase family)
MHKRTRELIAYGEQCGFELVGTDGREHWVMKHPNGSTVKVSGSPGDYRGDRNCQAEMRSKSGVTPTRPNAGKYRKGVRLEDFKPAEVRVDSKSHSVDVLRKQFADVCARIDWLRECGDRDSAAEAVAELLCVEERFSAIGVDPPVRSFRVYSPDGSD